MLKLIIKIGALLRIEVMESSRLDEVSNTRPQTDSAIQKISILGHN